MTPECAFLGGSDSAETLVMRRWPHQGRIIQAEGTAIRQQRVTLLRKKMKEGRVQAVIVR